MNLKAALSWVLLLLVGLVLALGAAEATVRALADPLDFTVEMWRYARELKRVSPDPRVGHEHVPGARGTFMGVAVSINSLGLRDREVQMPKPAGVKRVLMLGDSVTFGWGVAQDATVSPRLEALLNAEAQGPVEVLNLGVGNYNTDMEVQAFLSQGLRLQPDAVVLNTFINDAEPTPRYAGNVFNEHLVSWVYVAARLDLLRRMAGESQGWRTYYRNLYDKDQTGWSAMQAALVRLGEHCRAQRLPCLVADYPELHQLRDYPFTQQQQQVRAAVERAGLPYVDLLPAVVAEEPASLWVTVPDPHPNATAHALFAAALRGPVRALLEAARNP